METCLTLNWNDVARHNSTSDAGGGTSEKTQFESNPDQKLARPPSQQVRWV
jgi:hypothetical protein